MKTILTLQTALLFSNVTGDEIYWKPEVSPTGPVDQPIEGDAAQEFCWVTKLPRQDNLAN